jgi:group I intron endonuclease
MKITNFTTENELNDLKKYGVYKIYTKFSEQCYVGSTTRSFVHRWQQHLTDLKNNKHVNSALQNIVKKYGLCSLIFEIIEIINDKNDVIQREQYWIDLYDSFMNGYNCKPNAENSLGCSMTEDTKIKFYKKVSQYDMNGTYINSYKSLKDASEKTNTDYVTLSNVCNFKTKLANKFQWRFGESKETINSVRPKSNKVINQYDENNNKINEFLSIKEASQIINKAPNTLSTAIKRGVKCGGFFWKHK